VPQNENLETIENIVKNRDRDRKTTEKIQQVREEREDVDHINFTTC
jgi:hypothetical protein